MGIINAHITESVNSAANMLGYFFHGLWTNETCAGII